MDITSSFGARNPLRGTGGGSGMSVGGHGPFCGDEWAIIPSSGEECRIEFEQFSLTDADDAFDAGFLQPSYASAPDAGI